MVFVLLGLRLGAGRLNLAKVAFNDLRFAVQSLFRTTLAALASLLLTISPGEAETEPRLALLMGVGDYAGTPFSSLEGIDKDLQGMETALKKAGFEVTVVPNPRLSVAEEAVENFSAKLKVQTSKKIGVGLFYFSGHGAEFEGKNYLIPKGARIGDIRDIKEQALAAQRVLNRMEAAGTRVRILFLDCCRNDLTKAATETGLAPMRAKGTFIGFATGSDKTAAANSKGSPYTTILSKRLLTPGVSINDMHTQLTKEVEDVTREAGEEQTPFQYSGLNATFFFVPATPQPTASPASSASRREPSSPSPTPSQVPIQRPTPRPTPNERPSVQGSWRQRKIADEPQGDYFVGRRVYQMHSRCWGYVRRPKEPWNRAQLTIFNETQKLTPDNEALRPGKDNNYEYILYGEFSGRNVLDDTTQRTLPEFILKGYELISTRPPAMRDNMSSVETKASR
jgi:hypothetical protein